MDLSFLRHRRLLVALGTLLALSGLALAFVLEPPSTPREEGARLRMIVLRPSEALGTVAAGFGDVWADDRHRSRLLRLDGRGGGRLAVIPVQGRVALAVGPDAVWALQSGGGYGAGLRGPLLRIDPTTSRVSARIPLRTPGGERLLGFGVLAQGGAVWVWGPHDILRIDAGAGRVTDRIRTPDRFGELSGAALCGRRLVAATADGHLLRFDPRTGRHVGVVRVPLRRPAVRAAPGARVVLAAAGVVALADPATGRVEWRRRLGFRAGANLGRDGLLWVHSSANHDPGDRVTGLEPDTGRVVTTGVLPVFGSTGVAVEGERLWTASANGQMVVVLPFPA